MLAMAALEVLSAVAPDETIQSHRVHILLIRSDRIRTGPGMMGEMMFR